MTQRVQQRIDLAYRLAGADGQVSATCQYKTWFFDLPVERDNAPAFDELLNRIFYDANVKLRQREPYDTNWLQLDGYTVQPVDARSMLAWDGAGTTEQLDAYVPFIPASLRAVWEYTACHFVDESGAYDGMAGEDFAELVLYRALAAGYVTAPEATAFLDRIYPGHGTQVFEARQQRFANLVGVRPTVAFRRPPGTQPYVSGPPAHADLQPATS